MGNALIGYSGFVGGTLLRQRSFEAQFRSTNISESKNQHFDLVVCAAAPAQKWIANREPEADRRRIDELIEHLSGLRCDVMVLISTVDVYKRVDAVTEDSPIDEDGLQPYGLHRRLLEKFVESEFPRRLVARLPGLVGPGLKKNVIFDMQNDNNLHAVDSRGVFQFYPMVNLWFDLEVALAEGLELLNLTSEPISVEEVSRQGFGKPFHNELSAPAARYDMRSKHAALFGGGAHHQYSKRDTIQAIRAYAQSEPRTLSKGTTP